MSDRFCFSESCALSSNLLEKISSATNRLLLPYSILKNSLKSRIRLGTPTQLVNDRIRQFGHRLRFALSSTRGFDRRAPGVPDGLGPIYFCCRMLPGIISSHRCLSAPSPRTWRRFCCDCARVVSVRRLPSTMAIPVARVHLKVAHAALPALLPTPPKWKMLPLLPTPCLAAILPKPLAKPSQADSDERWDARKTKSATSASSSPRSTDSVRSCAGRGSSHKSATSQGKKYRPVGSEISEISRLPAGSEIFPLSSEIFIFLKFCRPNRRQSPPNTLTIIHV
jgi:hypothetical protein